MRYYCTAWNSPETLHARCQVLDTNNTSFDPWKRGSMGQYASMNRHLPKDVQSIPVNDLAKTLGFLSREHLDHFLSDDRFTDVQKRSSNLTASELLQKSFVKNIIVPVETVPNLVSFSRPFRPVCSSRVTKLEGSILHGGFITMHSAQLTVCIERSRIGGKVSILVRDTSRVRNISGACLDECSSLLVGDPRAGMSPDSSCRSV